jgi:hypothetical protein
VRVGLRRHQLQRRLQQRAHRLQPVGWRVRQPGVRGLQRVRQLQHVVDELHRGELQRDDELLDGLLHERLLDVVLERVLGEHVLDLELHGHAVTSRRESA